MKWMVAALTLALGGCVSVSVGAIACDPGCDFWQDAREYADCVKAQLADSRDPLVEERRGDGLRLTVPQADSRCWPAALLDIDERGGGSSIKLHERLSNFPLRLGDVRTAATRCISGS